MKRFLRFWKIIVLDALGVAFMVAALLTGWLPGPGGIPLFLVGLSLLALNHEWAERYTEVLKRYADRFGDLIFIERPTFQITYDVLSPIFITIGVYFLIKHEAIWMISAGVFLTALGITLFLGNRHRYREAKKKILKTR